MRLHFAVFPDVWSFALQLSRDLSIRLVIDPGGVYIYYQIYFQANTSAVKML